MRREASGAATRSLPADPIGMETDDSETTRQRTA